jgi:hypothetical protein
MEVPTLQQHQTLAERLERLTERLELVSLALSFAGWVTHTEAQRILKVARLNTLHEMALRKELEMRAVSERKYEVSLLSIAALLLKKGYTLQSVGERIAA